QTKIEYKAKDVGININYIKPDFTSQRCNHCGVIDKESRVTQEKFKCTNCGHTTNADLNAARNIAMPNIESIIKDQLKLQKKLK
ncbi:MAG: transposase, partial [Staphylococcus warneri]|nr:transposase [Staphylococcus warneri]